MSKLTAIQKRRIFLPILLIGILLIFIGFVFFSDSRAFSEIIIMYWVIVGIYGQSIRCPRCNTPIVLCYRKGSVFIFLPKRCSKCGKDLLHD